MAEVSFGKKSLSGAAWAGISRGVQQCTSMLSVFLLARILKAEDYGLMAMSGFFVNFLQQLGDLGTGSAIIQREHVSSRLKSSLFWMNLLIGFGGAILLVVASPAIALYYREPRIPIVLIVLAMSFPIAGAGIVHQSLLIREMEYRKLCIIEVSSSVVGALVSIFMAFNGAGVWSLVTGSVTLYAVSTVLALIYARWLPERVFDWQEIRSVLKFSVNLTGFVLVNYFSRNTGHLVVGRYLGTEALGYYQMAYNLLLYPLQALASVLGRVSFAAFSRMQTDPERFRAAIQRFLTVLGTVAFPVFFGLMVVADPMIRALLGEQWVPVIKLFVIVAPFGALQAIAGPTGQVYLSTGRTDVMLKLGIISMIIQVLGYFAGLPWGLEGVLLAWGLSSVPVGIAGLIVSHRLIQAPLGPLLRHLAPLAGAALGMAVTAWSWRLLLTQFDVTGAWSHLISTAVVGAAVYLAIILLIRAPVLRDIEQILTYSSWSIFVRLRQWIGRYIPA